jgi:hypothetical protein
MMQLSHIISGRWRDLVKPGRAPGSCVFPDLETLTAGLTAALSSNGFTDRQVTVINRCAVTTDSFGTYPKEIVRCRMDDGGELSLLCKYPSPAGRTHACYGHRGGLAYEAAVYRHVLQPLQASTPRFYGTYTDPLTGEECLIIECLDEAVPSYYDRATMILAARWIGRFHAAYEADTSSVRTPVLNRYDADYYLGWARRTAMFARALHQLPPWFFALCQRFEEVIAPLMEPPLTVIHGEYYLDNTLYHRGAIYPLDWESAAIAAGEIDLAMLCDRWPAEDVTQCKLEYQQSRWRSGPPTDFERRLDIARLYVQYRWLGQQRPRATLQRCLSRLKRRAQGSGKVSWRLNELRSAGERLGLI